jgi:carbonic anhydrase/acetyltransferase-like protein (isoleucine patch superfamily)
MAAFAAVVVACGKVVMARVYAFPCERAHYNPVMTDTLTALRPYLGRFPVLGPRVYVDPAATVIGDVELAEDVSIWPGTILRGDVNVIRVGARTNVQDGTIVHVSHHSPYNKAGYPTLIGADVTIGHGTIIHACTIEDLCLIGMGACILDGATVKKYGFLGAGAVLGPGKVVGEAELWLGNPARFARALTEKEIESLHYSAGHYVKLKDRYLQPTSPAA